jgi:hypothetical protein
LGNAHEFCRDILCKAAGHKKKYKKIIEICKNDVLYVPADSAEV